MQAHFTIPEILAATRGTLLQGGAAASFVGVSTDSRTCQAGQLFIPLKGENHDGHEFIPKALGRGARGVLVEERMIGGRGQGPMAPGPPLKMPSEITIISVPDTLAALGDLACAWRSRFRLPLVAITGSCGKTTTKEMTALVLSRAHRVLKNQMNLNNLIGLPVTLLGLDGTHDAVVVELGMNRFGEIRRLAKICRPTVGVLLNVHPAHTEGVGDVDGVARAKGELLEGLAREELLVYNADDPRLASLAPNFTGRTLGFGLGPGAQLKAGGRQPLGRGGQMAWLEYKGYSWPLTLRVPGLHQLYNALAATAAGLALGLAPGETAAALADFSAIHRRSQLATLPSGAHLLNDCYNANPGSMAMALRTLTELRDFGRAAAALGDMLELGTEALARHRELGRRAARAGLDCLVVYGNFRHEVAAGAGEAGLAPEAIHPVDDRAEGARILKEFLKPGDWLLVKGSRGMHMEGLIEALER